MTTAKQYFEDNIIRINPSQDPIGWNLNHGLVELAKTQQQQMSKLEELQRELRQLAQAVQQIRFR